MAIVEIELRLEQERATADNPYGLTPAERQLSRLMQKGRGHAEIRAQLRISPVQFDVLYRSMITKLRAQNDAQLQHLLCVLGAEPELAEIVDIENVPASFEKPSPERTVADSDDVVFAA